MYRMDEKDNRILRELALNSRTSFRKIAGKLGMATTTVISRHNRLKKEGIIKKHGISIDHEKTGYPIKVLIEIIAERGKLIDVEEIISKKPNVCAVYDITGETDAAVIARFRTRKELNDFLKSTLSMEHVQRTNTHLILNTVKEEMALPV